LYKIKAICITKEVLSIYKISILGNACAGKTTLSQNLSKKLKVPTYSIDEELKTLKTTPFPTRQQVRHFSRELDKLMRKDSWIIEGWCPRIVYNNRFKESNIIIFLDVPLPVCMKRLHNRLLNGSLTNDIKPKVINRATDKIYTFEQHVKPVILSLMNKYWKKDQSKTILHLTEKSNEEELIRNLKEIHA
jgi:adenylate kinase family enzyme